jgi:Ser/Thr protein kinase RdoA (MazF antagonist)
MEQFFSLTPDAMLGAVETALGARATGRTFTLNSLENRVTDIELEDESRVVTKFYRPGRWSREAILDEHAFLGELVAAEVPAVAPMVLRSGSTLAQSDDGILFAVFPKVRGRSLQELDDLRLQQIGRLLARLHNVGASAPAPHRRALTPETYGSESWRILEELDAVDIQLASRYRRAVEAIVAAITPRFAGVPTLRVHGDCHLGNVLWQESVPFFLDFDDLVTAPAVQDVWMVVRGRDAEAERQRGVLLDAYETMRAFDRATLRLVEPLRALRMIHYSAWIARRWKDPIFKQTFPEFVTYSYWLDEVESLEEQRRLIG